MAIRNEDRAKQENAELGVFVSDTRGLSVTLRRICASSMAIALTVMLLIVSGTGCELTDVLGGGRSNNGCPIDYNQDDFLSLDEGFRAILDPNAHDLINDPVATRACDRLPSDEISGF